VYVCDPLRVCVCMCVLYVYCVCVVCVCVCVCDVQIITLAIFLPARVAAICSRTSIPTYRTKGNIQ